MKYKNKEDLYNEVINISKDILKKNGLTEGVDEAFELMKKDLYLTRAHIWRYIFYMSLYLENEVENKHAKLVLSDIELCYYVLTHFMREIGYCNSEEVHEKGLTFINDIKTYYSEFYQTQCKDRVDQLFNFFTNFQVVYDW